MTALVVPWILLVLVLTAFLFLLRRKYITAVVLILIVFLINYWAECLPLRLFPPGYQKGELRVMSFNMNGEYDEGDAIGRTKLILEEAPDIVYLAEDFWGIYMQVDSILKKHYPYSSFSRNIQHYFYSKYPIVSCVPLEQDAERHATIEKALIDFKGDTLVLYGCHLSSNNYMEGHVDIREGGNDEKRFFDYLESIPYASELREKEAKDIVEDLEGRPIIVLGDMNDVAGSPCIRVLESAGLRDAWWEGGFGYGATIHEPLPYRIDHVMYSDGLKLKGIKKVSAQGLSDHDALVAEFDILK